MCLLAFYHHLLFSSGIHFFWTLTVVSDDVESWISTKNFLKQIHESQSAVTMSNMKQLYSTPTLHCTSLHITAL